MVTHYQESALTALVVGTATCISGIVLVLRHLHVWRQKTDASSDPAEQRLLWTQLRRRALTSTCIALLGFILSLFYFREFWLDRPRSWVILVFCALILLLMIFVMAVFDMLAVSNAIRADKTRTSNAAQELAREYHRQKQKTTDKPSEPPSDSAHDQT